MNRTSSSLSFLLTILLLTIPGHAAAAPPSEPMATKAYTTTAGEDAQWQSYTYVPADRLTELQDSFEQVTQQRDAAQQKSARLAEANDELRAQLDAARAELDETRQEMAQSRRAHKEELKQARHAAAQAHRELDEVRQVLAETQQQRDGQRREAERLKGKLDSGREAFDLLASLRDELEATSTAVKGLKSDVAGVRGELQAPAERKALKTQVRTLERDRQRLTEQLASERQNHAAAVQRVRALEQSVAARDLHKRELIKTMMRLETRLDTAEARSVQALDKQQAAPAEAAELRGQAEQRKSAIESLIPDLPPITPVELPASASWPASGAAEEQVAQRGNDWIIVPAP